MRLRRRKPTPVPVDRRLEQVYWKTLADVRALLAEQPPAAKRAA
jgi:hypothetical protein